MNLKVDSWQIQQAWELAWRTRFCPPDQLITADDLPAEAVAHLKSCPSCRRRGELGKAGEAGEGLPGLARPLAKPEDAGEELKPGQIRSLAPGLAGWGPKHRYYDPPVVLILELSPSLPNGVLVAQTYHDPALMGQGDVALGRFRFAEPWNLYTLHRENLGRLHGEVDQPTVELVWEAGQEAAPQEPEWSPQFLFRQMELEVACFFSAGAVLSLMAEYENAAALAQGTLSAAADYPLADGRAPLGPAWEGEAPEDLPACLARLGLKAPPAAQLAEPSDIFFLAEPSVRKMALAAANADSGPLLPVMAFRLQEGRPVSFEYLRARLTDLVRSPQLVLGGKLTSLLEGGERWRAEFRWLDEDGKLLKSRAGGFTCPEAEPASFWASFSVDAAKVADVVQRLYVRLFRVQEKQA
ncbi:hypothetical protein AAU61_05135 [Desulfocarbo indianensis]|nr:hypothetical protein AAU61_05135 [Desulfocarbo indianensis]